MNRDTKTILFWLFCLGLLQIICNIVFVLGLMGDSAQTYNAEVAQVTPLPSFTPTIISSPTPRIDFSMQDKKDGTWLVGTEIAVGKWRAEQYSDDPCSAFTFDKNDEILELALGDGAIIRVDPTAYKVQIYFCVWTYIGK